MASSCYEFARICSTKVTLCPSASSGPAPAVRSIQRHHLGLEVGALRQLRVDRVIGAGAGAAQDTGRAVGLGDAAGGLLGDRGRIHVDRAGRPEPRSVVEGKRVSGLVALGRRQIVKKKKKNT